MDTECKMGQNDTKLPKQFRTAELIIKMIGNTKKLPTDKKQPKTENEIEQIHVKCPKNTLTAM